MSTTKTTKPALWTDPWDGKQKVMERRQPRARADLLPPGVTAGVDGKWTYVPVVKLDQGRIRAVAAGPGHYDLVEAAAPKGLKVGGQARVNDCCSFSNIWGQVFRILKIDAGAGLAVIDYDGYVLALSSLEPL